MSNTTEGWPNLDVPTRVVFEAPPLVLALCQVKFATMLSVANPIAVAPFQEYIIDQYPIVSQTQNVKLQVEGNVNLGQASLQSSVGQINWTFKDTDDTWSVVLSPDALSLETRSYQDFGDFADRMERLLGALDKTIHPTVGLRIGLRYVNEIRPVQGGWKDAIRPELLGAFSVPNLSEAAAESIQQLTFRAPNGIGVNLQHGAILAGTTVNPRSGDESSSGPFYLLDLDVYEEFKPGTMTVKPRSIIDRVRVYHEVISQLFRWSVTSAYTDTLGRRSDETS